LLKAILPDFERRYNVKVDVIAVGTGQALKLGEQGDADILLVHARDREDAFVASGAGLTRRDVMYNDFVLVGPAADPLDLRGKTKVGDALRAISEAHAPFLSRGDDSGTYSKERALWASAGISPTSEVNWYKSLGQGMGETLIATNEQRGYTLSDRGTFLSMKARLPDLAVLVGGETIADNTDAMLRNPYGIIPVNPSNHPGIAADLAEQFAEWLIAPETQRAIGKFGKDTFGQPLFYPAVGQQAP
jgi:tungstate transport system substrate-binding protein